MCSQPEHLFFKVHGCYKRGVAVSTSKWIPRLSLVTYTVIVYNCLQPVGRLQTFAQDTSGSRKRYDLFESFHYPYMDSCNHEFLLFVLWEIPDSQNTILPRREAKTAPSANFFLDRDGRRIAAICHRIASRSKTCWILRDYAYIQLKNKSSSRTSVLLV